MFTREQVVEASVEDGLAALPQREFRFYFGDFVAPVPLTCLTVALFAPVDHESLARAWSAACFCHSENLCESWSVIRKGFERDFEIQNLTAVAFKGASGVWIDALNPELAAAISEIRSAVSEVHGGFSIVSGSELHSLIGIGPECTVALVWAEAKNA